MKTPTRKPAKTTTPSVIPTPLVDQAKAEAFVERVWDEEILPTITEYIRIPNKSPHFDKDWQKNGHMKRAADLIEAWCKKRKLPALKVERIQLEGRTPLLYMEIPGHPGATSKDDTIVLYGHLDKQP